MATIYSPSVTTSGLVLSFDAANVKSFKGEPTINLRLLGNNNQYARTGYLGGQWTYEGIETIGEYSGWEKIIATRTSTANRLIMHLDGITAQGNTQYTASIEFVSPFNNLTFNLTGNQGFGDAIRIGNSNRYFRTFTKNATTAGQHWYLASTQGNANFDITNGVIYYRQIQWEQKPYVTPWINGERGTTVATGGGWADLSNNQNHGELIRDIRFNSDGVGSMVLDGIDSIITIPSANSYKTDFPITISLFARLSSINGYAVLFVADDTNSSHRGYSFICNPFNSGFRLSSGYGNGTANAPSGRRTYITSVELAFNTWYHFVSVIPDSSTCQIYVNGEPITTTFDSGTANTMVYSSGEAVIGSRTDGLLRFLHGNVAFVNLYHAALTAADIKKDFDALRNRFGI